jgi:hypothetical protein
LNIVLDIRRNINNPDTSTTGLSRHRAEPQTALKSITAFVKTAIFPAPLVPFYINLRALYTGAHLFVILFPVLSEDDTPEV